MVLIQTEGWKEVKVVAISEVHVQVAGARARDAARPSRRDDDPLVRLRRHSYQAGLWDADTFAPCHYAEGLRRGLDHCAQATSTNDGSPGLERVTRLNFPAVPPIIDWSHATQHVWTVAQAVHDEHTPAALGGSTTKLDFVHLKTSELQGKLAEKFRQEFFNRGLPCRQSISNF